MNRLTLEERKRANKIRCKLLYTIDRDIRQSKKNNQKHFLINSMTLQEIEDKFLLFPNYKMKLSTTFTKIANKYMVMKTVDNKTKKNFFYSDYLQDFKKVNHRYVKLERKKTSANNIYKIPFLRETQELQSPMPEIFTNKMNIGDKKLIKPEKINMFPLRKNNSICKTIEHNEIEDKDKEENITNKRTIVVKSKNKTKKNNNNNDDSSVSSLTLELIQKKANFLSASLNNRNKKELKRRKMQLEAIKKLRQFCFTNLRNKRRCITKSSHPNLIYINKKFDDEDEKNNSSVNSTTSENNIKNSKNSKKNKNNKTKVNNGKKNSKNNSKKKNEISSKSKKKKNTLLKIKDKKKNINSTGKKLFRKDSSRRSPIKVKNFLNPRKSFVINNNIITEKVDTDIFKFKKRKKEKNDTERNINSKNPMDEDVLGKFKNHIRLKKKTTGILRESFKDKIINKNPFFLNQQKLKNKNIVNFNEFNTTTKRTCSANNFFKKKNKTKQFKVISTRNLMKTIKHFKAKPVVECKESKSDRHRRYSIPNKDIKDLDNENDNNEAKSEKSIIIHNFDGLNTNNYNKKYLYGTERKEKKIYRKFKGRNTQIFNIDKIKLKNEIYQVEEEVY